MLPIGGIKGEVLGAHLAGITDIILPADNAAEVEDIPADVRGILSFHFVSELSQAFEIALLPEEVREAPHAAQ